MTKLILINDITKTCTYKLTRQRIKADSFNITTLPFLLSFPPFLPSFATSFLFSFLPSFFPFFHFFFLSLSMFPLPFLSISFLSVPLTVLSISFCLFVCSISMACIHEIMILNIAYFLSSPTHSDLQQSRHCTDQLNILPILYQIRD